MTAQGFTAARQRPAGSLTIGATIRNYTILLLLIVVGSAGSVGVVGGLRALFGVQNWPAPIHTLIDTVAKWIG